MTDRGDQGSNASNRTMKNALGGNNFNRGQGQDQFSRTANIRVGKQAKTVEGAHPTIRQLMGNTAEPTPVTSFEQRPNWIGQFPGVGERQYEGTRTPSIQPLSAGGFINPKGGGQTTVPTTTTTTTTTMLQEPQYINYADNQRRQQETQPQQPRQPTVRQLGAINEPVIETAAQQFTRRNVNVLYRVMRQIKWGGAFTQAIEYDKLQPSEREARGDTTIEDVIATRFNSALDISNMKHESNGKFHIITKAPKKLFLPESVKPSMELEIDDNRYVFTTSMVTFKIQTIHNSTFAILGFGVNNFSHSMFQSSLEWAIPIAASLLETGALAGYDAPLVIQKFPQFTIWINSSTGGVAEGTGVVFNRVTLGPFDTASIVKERRNNNTESNFTRFTAFIRVVQEAWQKAIAANFMNYSDDTDLDGLLIDTEKAKILAANRRIESCILKFFPRRLQQNPIIPITEPSQIQPQIIDGVTQFVITPQPIILGGDAPFRPLSTLYMQTNHTNGPQLPTMNYSNILNSNLIAGIGGLDADVFVQNTKNDKVITEGRLKHYIEQKLIKILQPASRLAGEEDVIPAQIMGHDEPKRRLNMDLGEDRLNEILFAKTVTILEDEMPALNQLTNDPTMQVENIDVAIIPEPHIPEPIPQPDTSQMLQFQTMYEDVEADEWAEAREYAREKDIVYEDSDPWGMGCLVNKQDTLPVGIGREPIIWCPPGVLDNDCFFRCLQEALKDTNSTCQLPQLQADDIGYAKWREYFQIEHNYHVNLEDLEQIADKANYRITVYEIVKSKCHAKSQALMEVEAEADSLISHTIQQKFIAAPLQGNDLTININLMAHKDHCYLIKKLQYAINKVKCARCCTWIVKANFSKHIADCAYCSECRRTYKRNSETQHACRQEDIYRKTPADIRNDMQKKLKTALCEDWMAMKADGVSKKLKIKKKIWFADIETLPDANDAQYFKPYAVGLICMENLKSRNVIIFYGENCMRDYLLYLSRYVTGNLYYFNGSSFDNYIHIKAMFKYGYALDPRALIKMGKKIMTFSFNSYLKVYDLWLFVRCPLEKACKAWGVPQDTSKGEFNHDKIRSYADAEKHKEEVIEYLKLDVLALGTLMEIYQKAMWECFTVDVASVMTPAQLAMKAWKTTIQPATLTHFYIPHPGKEEEDDREAYYGGRVMCQRKFYDSSYLKEYEGCKQIPWNYDDVEDYIVIGDVNSLYPSVMHENAYAYGKWKYQIMEEFGEELHQSMLNIINQSGTYSTGTHEFFIRRMFLVDISCPKDLITAFLMERATDGSILHNLNDKVKKWYWGCELHEAIVLGYRVTKIYELKVYEQSGTIFKDYIAKCWNERKKYPGGTPKNLCFKQAMNDLTGKFGQKTHLTNTVIYNTNHKPDHHAEKNWEADMSRVVDFEMLFTEGETGESFNNAIILEIFAKDGGPNYPIAFSAQILAYARVHMSRIMRACDAYRNKERAIYYTDTDSLVMPSACIADLEKAGYIGKGLGQLKCDLNDSFFNNQFAKIVKGAWAATKGPYSMVYLLPDSCEPMEKIKVKGIPHIKEPVKYEDPVKFELDATQEELLERVQAWLEKPHTYNIPGRVIKSRFYLFKSLQTEESYYAHNVNQEMIRMMMHGEGHCYAYYGNMKNIFNGSDGRFMMVRPNAVMRTLCKTDWWSKQKRIYLDCDTEDERALTYPLGYVANQ